MFNVAVTADVVVKDKGVLVTAVRAVIFNVLPLIETKQLLLIISKQAKITNDKKVAQSPSKW